MEFTLTHPDVGTKTILVLFDGVPYEADSNHPWWDEIVDLVLDDDPRVLDLFPIRSVQQPSVLIEDESFSFFEGRSPDWIWDDTCDDPSCLGCHIGPDEQARREVEANLNYTSVDALATREIIEPKLERAEESARKWERLFGEAMDTLLAACNDLEVAEENNQIASQLLDSWQKRALILESAVKTYAGHIWNDLKRKLQEPTS
jgi:hypothetical protein